VGVNTAISTETGTNSGVGYAIPVNAVQRIAPALIAEGQYTYPYLGVSVFDGLDLAAQEQLGLPQATGAYVTTVTPNSPAGVAGVRGAGGDNARGGDLIIAIDGQTVLSFSDLITYLVFETEVGQTVTLTILRGEEQIDLPVVLGARP
jgi:2-alkenal reductase